jgi:hypothetical protein
VLEIKSVDLGKRTISVTAEVSARARTDQRKDRADVFKAAVVEGTTVWRITATLRSYTYII